MSAKRPPSPLAVDTLMRQESPHDLEAEQAVLGGLFLRRSALDELAPILRPEDFYSGAHAEIWRAALALHASASPVDLVTVTSQLQARGKLDIVGGPVYLAELVNSPVSPANAKHHAAIVAQHALRREIEAECLDLFQGARDHSMTVPDLIGSATRSLASIAGRVAGGQVAAAPELVNALVHDIEERQHNPGTASGITTGFVNLDHILGGWHPSDLVVIAGRPGMGKTAFALASAQRAALQGHPTLVFSLEMSREQLVGRMLCSMASVSTYRLRSSTPVTPDELQRLHLAAHKVQAIPLYLDDSPALRLLDIQAKSRRMVREKGVQLVIVDYLGLVRPDIQSDRSREQDVASISAGLKALAKELHIPVIALAQLNREVEKRKDGEPILSDLRESGAIEQDADAVVFVHCPVYASTGKHPAEAPAKLIVKKHRHGPCGCADLIYRSTFTAFEDAAPSEDWQ